MQIKQAAEKCRLTEKAIRLYEEKGLITPDITEVNGRKFRDYSDDTIAELETIAALRRAFFSIEKIAELKADPDRIPEIFEDYKRELHEWYAQITPLIEAADNADPSTLATPEQVAALFEPQNAAAPESKPQKPERILPRDFTIRVWDEDNYRDERDRAYAKYLGKRPTMWEMGYDLELAVIEFFRKYLKLLAFVYLPAVLFCIILFTQPLITEVDITYDGYEIELLHDNENVIYAEPYAAPLSSTPRTLRLKGKTYRYLVKRDYYEGEITISGYAPHTDLGGPYTLEEEFKYYNKFQIDIDRAHQKHSFVYGTNRGSEIKEIESHDILGSIYAEDLDAVAFSVNEYNGYKNGGRSYTGRGRWLIFPASTAEEAAEYYWTHIWETWQTEEYLNEIKPTRPIEYN